MKKTIIYVAIAALAMASACTRANLPETAAGGDIVLSFQFSAPIQTRTTTKGVGLENAVNSVDCFFYTDVTANPVYSFRDPNPTITQDENGNNIYTVSLTAGEANPFGEGNVPDLDVLLNNKQCEVFAVFNAPTAITAAPLATIKTTALANSFAHEGPVAGSSTGSKWVVTKDEEANDYPKYFVMTGAQTLTRTGNNAISGTVEMNRVAAKIAVDLNIRKSVTDANGKVWNPMLGGQQVRVYPQNIAGAAIIGGADATPTFPDDLSVFTYKEVIYQSYYPADYQAGGAHAGVEDPGTVVDDNTNYVIASQQDFYTYPMTWTRGSDDEPFIKVIVPWSGESGTSSQKEIYYKVMLPWTSIEANKYYKLTVNVSILGTEGEPEVTLEPLSAMVVDWQGGGKVNGTVSAAKYLSVERGVVTATSNYDTATGRFEFYTATSGTSYAASDPVTITIKEIKQKNLTTGNWEYLYQNGTANESEITKREDADGNTYTVNDVNTKWIQKVGDNYLQIGHQLNSKLTSTYMDVTPYYYTVILSLPAEVDPRTSANPYGEYAKTVTFVQWPNIYVVEELNSNYVSDQSSLNTNNSNKGYVYVNGNNTATNGFDNVRGLTDATNTNNNPHMYILTISVSDTYKIGDPRVTTVDLISYGNNWKQSYWTGGTGSSHRLTYYYPSARTGVDNMIAPKIRIASSYGKAQQMNKQSARRRCASYQEDGVPAGRWRLPTFAEVKFIATLSSLGRIPILFSDENTTNGDYYWVADGNSDTTGAALVDNVGNDKGVTQYLNHNSNSYVRCVYDEWYWGDQRVTKNQFTWGDRQRTSN